MITKIRVRLTAREEAGFLAALLDEPEDRTTLLVYADWLDERAEPRGEYLRLLATNNTHEDKLTQLRSQLDADWVQVIASRGFKKGSLTKILDGPFQGMTGQVVEIPPDRLKAQVFPIFFGRPILLEFPFTSLELIPDESEP